MRTWTLGLVCALAFGCGGGGGGGGDGDGHPNTPLYVTDLVVVPNGAGLPDRYVAEVACRIHNNSGRALNYFTVWVWVTVPDYPGGGVEVRTEPDANGWIGNGGSVLARGVSTHIFSNTYPSGADATSMSATDRNGNSVVFP
jgi:hypothetical protein